MNSIELKKYGFGEYCELDLITGKKEFSTIKKIPGFTGLYYMDQASFFAIYPTKSGPCIYYGGKEFSINKELTISLLKNDKQRKFTISDYDIEIEYRESPYIDFDVWSEEVDVDLFYMIEQSYKSDDFYERYTSQTKH
ncbi:hypothetical protein D3P09_16595 [Paenibacillus pinisoli]|uniref:Uncharacterized protein n=1 Tax=Paenibacillus pinisoli TaxID=1276110 RepID=A0A3A6PCJ0_9BACL|nr:hypothetical protein [Paenibacillus pinisoli]RJX39112.1 hypothetical protein D3P09_16595 [Paenibacillus pinisoli]